MWANIACSCYLGIPWTHLTLGNWPWWESRLCVSNSPPLYDMDACVGLASVSLRPYFRRHTLVISQIIPENLKLRTWRKDQYYIVSESSHKILRIPQNISLLFDKYITASLKDPLAFSLHLQGGGVDSWVEFAYSFCACFLHMSTHS